MLVFFTENLVQHQAFSLWRSLHLMTIVANPFRQIKAFVSSSPLIDQLIDLRRNFGLVCGRQYL